MLTAEEEKKLIGGMFEIIKKEQWRKKKINELMERVKKGGKLTNLERNILVAWQKHYGNR